MQNLMIYPHFKTSYGGGGIDPFHRVSYVLMRDAPFFGSALERLFITTKFICRSPQADSPFPQIQKELFDEYSPSWEVKPKYAFYRSKKELRISFMSKIDENILYRHYYKHHETMPTRESPSFSDLDAELLRFYYDELLVILERLPEKIQDSDDFDTVGFINWAIARKSVLPADAASFAKLADDQLKWGMEQLFSQAELSQMPSDMQSLGLIANKKLSKMLQDDRNYGIDMTQIHPYARRILDDDFFWDYKDSNSPHGGEVGIGVLCSFQKWRKRNRSRDSNIFLDEWLIGFGLDPALPDDFGIADTATLALAFAHIKVDGSCPERIRSSALTIVETWIGSGTGCKVSLEKMRTKLLV